MSNIETGSNAAASTAAANTTLHFRRFHPGGGPLGRCSYGIPNGRGGFLPGIVVVDMGMFVGGVAPKIIALPFAMVGPVQAGPAAVTSAVVAAGNVEVTAAAAAPAIAAPAAVAATAAATVGKLVSKAGASKGHKAAVA